MQVARCSLVSKQSTPNRNIAFSGKEEFRAELAEARRKLVIAKAKHLRLCQLAEQFAKQHGISMLGALPLLLSSGAATAAAEFRCSTAKFVLTLSSIVR